MSDYEAGDIIRFDSPDGSGFGLVASVASDGDIHLQFSRVVLHAHEDDHELIERTGNPDLSKREVVERAKANPEVVL